MRYCSRHAHVSLFPFVTGWMGENHFSALPTAMYGVVLFMASIAYWILARLIISTEGKDSLVARAIGRDSKGMISTLMYAIAIPLAFVGEWMAQFLYVAVALMWFIPDRRIEKVMPQHAGPAASTIQDP